jgi:epoxyqueuosine reductase
MATKRKRDLMRFTRSVKELARERGADLVGIAPGERFSHCPPEQHPARYLPPVRAVISLAIRVNRAGLKSILSNTSIYSYCIFGFKAINERLHQLAFEMARFLEDEGFEAYPVPANAPRDPRTLKAEISHRHAAVAAGLGQMGWGLSLLTPQFGAWQKLVSVITSAPLEPDSLYQGTLCRHCLQCVHICPVGAISERESDGFCIDGRLYQHAHLERWRCRWGCGGLTSRGTFAFTDIPLPEREPTPDEMMAFFARLDPAQMRITLEAGGTFPWCSKCLAVCGPKPQ